MATCAAQHRKLLTLVNLVGKTHTVFSSSSRVVTYGLLSACQFAVLLNCRLAPCYSELEC